MLALDESGVSRAPDRASPLRVRPGPAHALVFDPAPGRDAIAFLYGGRVDVDAGADRLVTHLQGDRRHVTVTRIAS